MVGVGESRLLCAVLAAALLACPAANARAADNAELTRAWGKLFAVAEPAETKAAIDNVLAVAGNSAETVQSLIASDTAYPAVADGWQEHTLAYPVKGVPQQTPVHVRVPKGYDPAKRYPLLLAVHGSKGEGGTFGRAVAQRLGAGGEKYILAAPTIPEGMRFGAKPHQVQPMLATLDWVQQQLHVDSERVYVLGYSMGGHCTWHVATMYPRRFAAAVPMAGIPWFPGGQYTCNIYLENLGLLPTWAIWGELDRSSKTVWGTVDICRSAAKRLRAIGSPHFTGTELAGAKHGECWPAGEKLLAYLAKHKRQPAPAKYTRFFHMTRNARGYYVEPLAFSIEPLDLDAKLRLKVALPPGRGIATEAEVLQAAKTLLTKRLFRTWVELDRPANTLTIRAPGVVRLRIYALAGMFDHTRPITLRMHGKTWQVTVPASPRCMLTHYVATRDAAGVVCNEIVMDLKKGAPIVKYAK